MLKRHVHSPFAAHSGAVRGRAALRRAPAAGSMVMGQPRATVGVGNSTPLGIQWVFMPLRGNSWQFAEIRGFSASVLADVPHLFLNATTVDKSVRHCFGCDSPTCRP